VISGVNPLSILILIIPIAVSIFGASIAYYNQISVTSFSLNMIAVLLGKPIAFLVILTISVSAELTNN